MQWRYCWQGEVSLSVVDICDMEQRGVEQHYEMLNATSG